MTYSANLSSNDAEYWYFQDLDVTQEVQGPLHFDVLQKMNDLGVFSQNTYVWAYVDGENFEGDCPSIPDFFKSLEWDDPEDDYNNDQEYFVYSRPMPEKVGGLYMNVPWSDVALQNVPKGSVTFSPTVTVSYTENNENEEIAQNGNAVQVSIDETYHKDPKGEGKYVRARKIPQKKNKNYPTKVKNDVQVEKQFGRFMKYNEINNFGM